MGHMVYAFYMQNIVFFNILNDIATDTLENRSAI
jgi:hypothetical protein